MDCSHFWGDWTEPSTQVTQVNLFHFLQIEHRSDYVLGGRHVRVSVFRQSLENERAQISLFSHELQNGSFAEVCALGKIHGVELSLNDWQKRPGQSGIPS